MKSSVSIAGSRSGKAKKRLLWALAVLVLLVVGVVALAPTLVSLFVRGTIERELNAQINGKYEIDGVSLSWGGPQKVGPLRLFDPSGGLVGEGSLSVEAGLLGMLTGGLDIGEMNVQVRGDIKQIVSPSGKDRTTNLEEALRPRAGVAASVPRPGAAQPGAPAQAAGEVRLPKGLAAKLRVTNSEVKYTGELTPGSGVRTIGITGLTASGDFALGQPLKLTITANTLDGQRALQVDATADNLSQADGLLTFDKASADAKIEGAVPAEYLELIAARGGAGTGGSGAGDPPARVGAHVVLKDGRLTLADPSRPAFVDFKVPAAALAVPGKEGGASPLTVSERPTISLLVQTLDLPVPFGRTTTPDYRGGKITSLIRSTRMSGTASVGDAGSGGGKAAPGAPSPRPFSVEPFELRLATPDLVEGIGLLGEINTTLDGRSSGRIALDLMAADMLDSAGAMRAGGPGKLRGRFVVESVPTAILQPMVQPMGIDLSEALGQWIKADIRAGILDPNSPESVALAGGSAMAGAAPVPGSSGGAKGDEASASPYFAGSVVTEKTRLWFDVFIDPDKVRSRNEGVKVQTTALGYLVRRFLPEGAGVTVTGDGIASIEAATFELPGIMGGKGPDLSRMKADVRVIAGELTAQVDGRGSPVTIKSIDLVTAIDGEKSPKVTTTNVLVYEGREINAGGELMVTGLFKKDSAAASGGGGVALSIKDARPEGTISIKNVPASIASVAGEQARRIADAAIGTALNLDITAAPGEGGSSTIDLELASAGMNGAGQFVVGGGRVKTVGEGVSLRVSKPADVLNAVLNPPALGGGGGAKVVVDSDSDLTVRVSGIDVALGDDSIKPATLAAKASIATAGMGLTLSGPQGRGERVLLSSLVADAVLDGKGGADVTVDTRGVFQNSVFSAKGTLGAGQVLGDSGADIRTVEPRGSMALSQVPSSLVALFSPENAVLAQAVLGGTVDAQVSALTEGKGVEFVLTTPQVKARSRAVIAGDKVTVGPTSAEASLSPQTLDTVLALKAPDLTPRPALAGVSRFTAEVTPVTLPILGPTQLGTNPIGGYRATVKTDGDMVVQNATVLGAGTNSARPLNVGIRLLGAALVKNTDPSMPLGEITASAELFDPANPGPTIVKARLDGGAMLPQQLKEMTIEVPSTAALDRWLGTPELASLALGETVKIMAMGQPVTAAGAGVLLTSIVESPKLQTRVAVGMNENGTKVQPFDAEWTLDPALANRYLFVDAQGKPTARLARAVKMTLAVKTLDLGPLARLLDPRIFRSDIVFAAPGLAIVTPDGVEADLGNLQGRLGSVGGSAAGAIAFELSTPGVRLTSMGGRAAPASGDTKPLTIKGVLEDLADATGALTPERLLVSAKIDGGLPTPLIDALAGQGGALVDLLGARVDTAITTTRLGKQSGSLAAALTADNATAMAEGEVRDGTFVASKQVVARMSRITPEASKRYISTVVPLLDKVEKTRDDKPAVITADGLTAPLDGDMSKLNGDLVFDLGTVQFQSSDFFGEILKATSNAAVGKIGQKIPPFKAKVRQGVVNYDRFTIPTGEFEISTEGKVDLVKKKMRLTVWVPLPALADEIAGALKLGSLPGLRDLNVIPLKMSGDLDKPDIDVDWERIGNDIIRLPGKAAEGAGGGVEDVIKGVGDLFKKKKKK